MNSIVLIITTICILALAHRYYAAFIAAKVLILDDSKITPANKKNNKHDYIPTNKWILFGHHFAAIAGAGPLIGPALAAQFGWGPAFFWIILGSVFAGGIHDMVILFASVRHNGHSLAQIAQAEISSVAGGITVIISFFSIIITLSGVGITVVNALYNNPWGIFAIGMTIPISIVFGIYTFCFKDKSIIPGSIISVVLVAGSVFAWPFIANPKIISWLSFDKPTLSLILPTYAFFAAVLPIWLLLTPRGYLSTYMKIGVVIILAIGLLFARPEIKMPMTTQFLNGNGPIINGPWWPYVFITIACGAISGFHALISTGTTSKLVAKEGDIPMIGYGAMLVEAFVAVMALIATVTLIPSDYFAINASKEAFAALDMQVVDLPKLSSLIGLDVMHRPGGATSLAVGMANIFVNTSKWLVGSMKYWFQFVIMFEALFILTLIDTGTRVARYILENILSKSHSKVESNKTNSNVMYTIITSVAVSVMWGYLLYTGNIASIWPLFGSTNQALAALVLAIGTTFILKTCKKKYYALTTALPCAFVSITALWACLLNIKIFLKTNQKLNILLCLLITLMIIIAIEESIRSWIKILKAPKKN